MTSLHLSGEFLVKRRNRVIHQIFVEVNEHFVGADHVKQEVEYKPIGKVEIAVQEGEADLPLLGA